MKRFGGWMALAGLLLLLAGCGPAGETEAQRLPNPAHPSFVTYRQLAGALSSVKPEQTKTAGRQISGVAPHHLVAGRLIAGYFAGLAQQNPELIIIIGPNHQNRGGPVITGFYDWQTPEGLVKTDKRVVEALLADNLAVQDEEILGGEHSIGSLAPFVRHYLPGARIVPIILHHGVDLSEVDKLLAGLSPYLDEEAVLVASVDFSHYLTAREAEAKDAQTLAHMRNFDLPVLFRWGDDHLDSPASLAAAFRWAEGRGVQEFQVLDHTNSGIIMNNDYMETTSYFTLVFTR